jgi:hypothetical protein
LLLGEYGGHHLEKTGALWRSALLAHTAPHHTSKSPIWRLQAVHAWPKTVRSSQWKKIDDKEKHLCGDFNLVLVKLFGFAGTHSSAFAREALHHLSHTPVLFAVSCF